MTKLQVHVTDEGAGNTGKAQQQSSLCRETAELRLIIPVLKPITPAIAFQKLDYHSPAARRAEKEEREREREREHEHKRRRLRRLIIDNETPQKKGFSSLQPRLKKLRT
jgi:hypothetical protein